MNAVLLAAGVGRRLASLDGRSPKCLLSFEGKSLLWRHLESLEALGIERLLIVVGHEDSMIRDEVKRYTGSLPVDFAFNEHYREGSVLSLKTGLEAVLSGPLSDTILMDADVLYHQEVLTRLVEAPFQNGFLLDKRSTSDGENMMLAVKDGLVRRIARTLGPDWDVIGEGVGFFKIRGADLQHLLNELDALLDAGQRNADYENGIDNFLAKRPAGWVPVGDLPWMEIDFDEDVEQARKVVLPAIQELC
jgi:choline kinase